MCFGPRTLWVRGFGLHLDFNLSPYLISKYCGIFVNDASTSCTLDIRQPCTTNIHWMSIFNQWYELEYCCYLLVLIIPCSSCYGMIREFISILYLILVNNMAGYIVWFSYCFCWSRITSTLLALSASRPTLQYFAHSSSGVCILYCRPSSTVSVCCSLGLW
jgi:hypothetical protein